MATRTALVTGGNRGLGQETCRRLAADGWKVLLGSRDPAKGKAAAARIRGDVTSLALDVASAEKVKSFAAESKRRGIRLDALVNNAGIYRGEPAEILEVNFFGALRVLEALEPLLADGASVVNVSSGLGSLGGFPETRRRQLLDPELSRDGLVSLVEDFLAGGKGWPGDAYAVSKASIDALTRLFAAKLEARRIKVNSVCPGWVRTQMGGRGAPRSVEEGADGIVWAAELGPDGPSGGLFRDGKRVTW